MMGVLGSEAELSRDVGRSGREAMRSCLVRIGVLGSEAELSRVVDEHLGRN